MKNILGKYGCSEEIFQLHLKLREEGCTESPCCSHETRYSSRNRMRWRAVVKVTFYQRAIAIQEQSLVLEHPDTIATQEALSKLAQMVQAQEQQGAARQPKEVPPA